MNDNSELTNEPSNLLDENPNHLTNFSRHFFGVVILGLIGAIARWIFDQGKVVYARYLEDPTLFTVNEDVLVLLQVSFVLGGILLYWSGFLSIIKKVNNFAGFEFLKIRFHREDYRNFSTLLGTGAGILFLMGASYSINQLFLN